jgi:hypothetical protein
MKANGEQMNGVDIAVDIFGGMAVDCGCYKKRLIWAWLIA